MTSRSFKPRVDFPYFPAATLASLVVFLLFLGLNAMISVDLGEPDPIETFSMVDIWQDSPPLPPPLDEELQTPEPVLPPPTRPTFTEPKEPGGYLEPIGPEPVDPVDPVINGAGDGNLLMIVAVQPEYPPSALERGLEGYCTVSFIVTTAGTTRDIVVEACSNRIFASATERAAARLKYQPRRVNGQPVETRHQEQFRFEITA